MAMKNIIGRTTGVYGEAYIQFELARRGWVVDAIGATASGIDLLAWRPAQPGMGISVKTRLRDDKNQRVSVTFFKSEKHMQDMREACALRGVKPYICSVVFTSEGTRAYLMSLDHFIAKYKRPSVPGSKRAIDGTVELYQNRDDTARYDADPEVIKCSGITEGA
jgi:hypothetical protein